MNRPAPTLSVARVACSVGPVAGETPSLPAAWDAVYTGSATRTFAGRRQLFLPVVGMTIWYRRYRKGHKAAGSATEAEASGRQVTTSRGCILYERAERRGRGSEAGSRWRSRASANGELYPTRAPGCGPRRSSPFCAALLRRFRWKSHQPRFPTASMRIQCNCKDFAIVCQCQTLRRSHTRIRTCCHN